MTGYRVTAPHFVAGIETREDKIVAAAPILAWAIGKRLRWFQGYCLKKRWTIERLKEAA